MTFFKKWLKTNLFLFLNQLIENHLNQANKTLLNLKIEELYINVLLGIKVCFKTTVSQW